ncbi:unnamed protein product [Coffea canephora]|uniref:Beta-galactosidase beta-sandwich domain-containing protein n=1 Tax=Coffea canephora TaxID=49390 RepID=A0A068UI17_COFCA|nr:unnamed protein product [Coffea canephora]
MSLLLSSQFSPHPILIRMFSIVMPLGNYQGAHVFKSKFGACALFLVNCNSQSLTRVAFGNMDYHLPPWSISILTHCKIMVYQHPSFSHLTHLIYVCSIHRLIYNLLIFIAFH